MFSTERGRPDYTRFAVLLLRRIDQSFETVSARHTISHGSRDVLPMADGLATRWQVSRVSVQTFHEHLYRSSDLRQRNIKGLGVSRMNACHSVNEPEASPRSTWHAGHSRTSTGSRTFDCLGADMFSGEPLGKPSAGRDSRDDRAVSSASSLTIRY